MSVVENTKLCICLLTSGRIFESIYGGEERFTISLGEWLEKENHEVILMASEFSNVKAMRFSEFAKENIKVEKVSQEKMRVLNPPYLVYVISRIVLSFLWILKIRSTHRQSRIDIIHAQDTGYSGLAAVIAGKFLRIPVVLSSHGIRHKTLESIITGKLRKVFLKFESHLDIFTIRNADHVIAVSQPIKDYLKEITAKEINFIPISIKFKNYQYSERNREIIRKELGIDEKEKVIGFVGRFSLEKNLFTLLQSFADTVEFIPNIKLVLVGTGTLESQFRAFLKKRGVENKVIFCGVRYDIEKILSSLDIFVLPSYSEGMSTALLEAMACGRAIVCSEIPANKALVTDYENGLLVNPYNSEQLGEAIKLLISDNALRIRLGENAKIKANDYDEENVFPIIIQNYFDVLRKYRH